MGQKFGHEIAVVSNNYDLRVMKPNLYAVSSHCIFYPEGQKGHYPSHNLYLLGPTSEAPAIQVFVRLCLSLCIGASELWSSGTFTHNLKSCAGDVW